MITVGTVRCGPRECRADLLNCWATGRTYPFGEEMRSLMVQVATLHAPACLKSGRRCMSTVHTRLVARGFLDPETEAVPLRTPVEISSVMPSLAGASIGDRVGVLGVGIGTCCCLVSGGPVVVRCVCLSAGHRAVSVSGPISALVVAESRTAPEPDMHNAPTE